MIFSKFILETEPSLGSRFPGFVSLLSSNLLDLFPSPLSSWPIDLNVKAGLHRGLTAADTFLFVLVVQAGEPIRQQAIGPPCHPGRAVR